MPHSMPARHPLAASVAGLLRSAVSSTVASVTSPVTNGSRRNAHAAVMADRGRARARAEAYRALDAR